MTDYRDVEPGEVPPAQAVPVGRRVVAVIGIDKYRSWGRLRNAVNDALGVRNLLRELGFEELVPPLLDDEATFVAMRRLVITDLRKQLHEDDSLVLFFAGHGYTETSELQGTAVRVGYIIPVDSDGAGGGADTWIELETWLKEVTRLPARHVLVILDSCHSGMALELSRVRGASSEPLQELLSRRSRRVITSALDDQQALDSGPVPDHSLFTGLLVRALQGDLAGEERTSVTGAELAVHLQRCVSEHRGSAQTPDFGTLPLDAGGDMAIPIRGRARPAPLPSPIPPDTTLPSMGSAAPSGYRRLGLVAMAASVVLALGLVIAATLGAFDSDHPGRGNLGGGSGDGGASIGPGGNAGGSGDGSAATGPAGNVDGGAGIDGVENFDRPGEVPVIDARIAGAPDGIRGGNVSRPAIPRRPVRCYRLPTGGYTASPPTCASSFHCDVPEAAVTANQSFVDLHCEHLCTCH